MSEENTKKIGTLIKVCAVKRQNEFTRDTNPNDKFDSLVLYYRDENGNSFVGDLMNEIRLLPKVSQVNNKKDKE